MYRPALSFCFHDGITYLQKFDFFFDFRAEIRLVSLTNNLRIILGSQLKIFKNIEAQKKVGYSYKKSVCQRSNEFCLQNSLKSYLLALFLLSEWQPRDKWPVFITHHC